MKERIVIEKNNELFVMSSVGITISPTEFEHTIEQVPESFRELRKMCIDLKNKDLEINVNSVEYAKIGCIGLTFDEEGKVYDCEGEYLATDLTPQQMWQIIKSLIGE